MTSASDLGSIHDPHLFWNSEFVKVEIEFCSMRLNLNSESVTGVTDGEPSCSQVFLNSDFLSGSYDSAL